MSNWQPIETAPKGKGRLLVGDMRRSPPWVTVARRGAGGWWCYGWNVLVCDKNLTHWCPIPDPPTEET